MEIGNIIQVSDDGNLPDKPSFLISMMLLSEDPRFRVFYRSKPVLGLQLELSMSALMAKLLNYPARAGGFGGLFFLPYRVIALSSSSL
jgi:hypothetical protein